MKKEVEVVIEKGRDAGKKFRVTEMPAFQADRWATRALMALGKSTKGGIMGLAGIGIQGVLEALSDAEYEKIEPLLQELLECASFVKDGTSVIMKKEFVDGVVEDWTTLYRLRYEALQMIIGFLDEGDGLDTK